MGASGTGKTSFINAVTNSDLPVGLGLEPCTRKVQLSLPFEICGIRIQFVDTPGDEETDTLRLVSDFLAKMYEQRTNLAGVLYFQDLSSPRVGGISRRSMRIFYELCGDSAMSKVTIVTTGSSIMSSEEYEAELRENPKFFRAAIEGGARLVQYHGSVDGAKDIVSRLVEVAKERGVTLRIQEELLANYGGRQLKSEWIDIMRKHEDELEDIRATTLNGASEQVQLLAEALEGLQAQLASTLEEKDRLVEENVALKSGQTLSLRHGVILGAMLILAFWIL
ncbi:hypothetical protein BT96DRAFT_920751 [Gymnopus androsaceus JB14]|uniref:G domain-containing protein n=1 Tax=Gymnopus androsaceus JB14 TaxID=1447944 RepID=A0A6A4HKC5_9AGAR|nr:hypothetical protein BT96DRAFT_920751 [Gymnopus androsaceus JB14]